MSHHSGILVHLKLIDCMSTANEKFKNVFHKCLSMGMCMQTHAFMERECVCLYALEYTGVYTCKGKQESALRGRSRGGAGNSSESSLPLHRSRRASRIRQGPGTEAEKPSGFLEFGEVT